MTTIRHQPHSRKTIEMKMAEIVAKLDVIKNAHSGDIASNITDTMKDMKGNISHLVKLKERKKQACLIDTDNITLCDEYR